MLSPRNSSGTNIPQRKAIPSEIVFAIMFIIASFVVSLLIKNELNDEPYTPELLSCVKVHLWRKIKYSTKIKINEKLIENSLRK